MIDPEKIGIMVYIKPEYYTADEIFEDPEQLELISNMEPEQAKESIKLWMKEHIVDFIEPVIDVEI